MIHTETRNHCFLNDYKECPDKPLLEEAMFIHNKKLKDVDPLQEELSPIEKDLIYGECVMNPWYFFREVFRVGKQKYPLISSKGLLGHLSLMIKDNNSIFRSPKNTGRLMTLLSKVLYDLCFRRSNSNVVANSRNIKDLIFFHMLESVSYLPEYLRSDICILHKGTLVHLGAFMKLGREDQKKSDYVLFNKRSGKRLIIHLDEDVNINLRKNDVSSEDTWYFDEPNYSEKSLELIRAFKNLVKIHVSTILPDVTTGHTLKGMDDLLECFTQSSYVTPKTLKGQMSGCLVLDWHKVQR